MNVQSVYACVAATKHLLALAPAPVPLRLYGDTG